MCDQVESSKALYGGTAGNAGIGGEMGEEWVLGCKDPNPRILTGMLKE